MSLTLHDLLTPVNMKGITYSACTLCTIVHISCTIVIIIPTYTYTPRFQPRAKSFQKNGCVREEHPQTSIFW